MVRPKSVHATTVAAVAVVVALAGIGLWLTTPGPDQPSMLTRAAQIGGPFTLSTHDGRKLDEKALAGRPYAIFFGFTRCPDICPTTLLEMSNHLEALGERAARMATLFVTVDPEYDTVAHLAAYLASFDHRITGLTGTPAEINAIARHYRVFYEKVPTSGGYTMNHTASVYLMDAKGQFVGTMSFQEPQETQRRKLERLVGP